jgi:Peptidase A4 family
MRKLFVALLAAVLVVALGAVVAQSPLRSSSAAKTSREAIYVQARAAFKAYLSSHAPLIRAQAASSPGSPVLHTQGGPVALAAVASGGVQVLPSANWSGYADVESASSTVSGVSGRWTIPWVACPNGLYRNQDAFAAQWVGIDGATNDTVEQLGTGEQCFEDQIFYYVWYEMFPNGTVQEGTQACINYNVDCPRPGDQISASVNVTPGTSGVDNYTLALSDYITPGNNFSVQATCATSTCLDQSAEWVMERPAFELPFGPQILPLVDFTQDAYTNGTVTSGGQTTTISGFQGGPVYDIPMIDDSMSYYLDCVNQFAPPGQLLLTSQANACPAAAPQHGNSFHLTWDSSF